MALSMVEMDCTGLGEGYDASVIEGLNGWN